MWSYLIKLCHAREGKEGGGGEEQSLDVQLMGRWD